LTPERARGDVENPIPGIVSELDARFVVAEQRAWRNTDARADAARAGQRSVPISSPHFMAAIQAVHPVRRVSATLSVTLSDTLQLPGFMGLMAGAGRTLSDIGHRLTVK
jgi:hypothetical protein